MKISVNQNDSFQMEQVYLPITLVTEDKEEMSIVMRDSGFEFQYQGEWYSAKEGKVEPMRKAILGGVNMSDGTLRVGKPTSEIPNGDDFLKSSKGDEPKSPKNEDLDEYFGLIDKYSSPKSSSKNYFNEQDVELIALEMVNWAIDNIGNISAKSGQKFDEVLGKYKNK